MTDATLDLASSHDAHDHHEDGIATPRGVALFLLVVVAILAAVVYGAFTVGPWVLGVTAVATVPVIYLVLILLTMGR
ncbi:MAG: hypothetical protein HWE33_06995 [Rhodobacteraceae bacterium]|uniref:hypothetical protein n=1 Tax=Celeribacter sp. HF31 TaxID=2721558 RepID=UPI0014306881|nr:hypothetical protein [Celeribacter sp. HF31]NIY78355.1 hypothetical protein [Celeribacter sp. HF31]NVK46034.1 hypothetical protein [Paracoccaceae bacterium]